MRLDRFLSEMNLGTRSQVKSFIRQGMVTVNGTVVKNVEQKIAPLEDQVCFREELLKYQKYYYYMMNKPAGVVSATRDSTAPTVVSLLGIQKRDDIFPVGRLDKDTTGLLLLTNDGGLAHRLLSPRRHVDKVYQVTTARPLKAEDIQRLRQGVDIGEDAPTLPAEVEILEELVLLLTIQEGKYHQVKRMLEAVDNEVTALKRVAFGGLSLDEGLAAGEYRELTWEEEVLLKEMANKKNQADGCT